MYFGYILIYNECDHSNIPKNHTCTIARLVFCFAASKPDENNEYANNTIVGPEKVLEFQIQNEGKNFVYKYM